MAKTLKIILILILFIVFFEIGLFSSYTIVTSEAPDVKGLIDMQIQKITSVINPKNVNQALIKDPTPINISNKKDVALSMEKMSNVDGVNVASMNVSTYDDVDNDDLNVTIEALGYASPNSTSTQIVISQDPAYKLICSANATYKTGKLMVNTDSIKINSVLKLY